MKRIVSWPGIVLVLAAITALSMTGLARLGFDDDYKTIFRADDGSFETYLAFLEHFPAEERNLLAVLHGPVLSAQGVRALLATEHALIAHDGVATVYSPLSPPRVRTLAERFVETGDRDVLSALAARARDHPVLSRGFISADGDTALVAIALDARGADPGPAVEAARDIMTSALGPAGLTVNLGGVPAIRAALKSQVRHDQSVFNTLAAVLATGVAWWLFRSVRTVAAVAIGPSLGVAWTLGAMGLAGLSINVLTQMVGALVLVVGYTDSVHVTAHLRRALAAGASRAEAVVGAWRDIGPACLVTSLTTAAGFASLLLSDAWMVRQFGAACAVGSLTVFAAVMLSVPLTARVLEPVTLRDAAPSLLLAMLHPARRYPRVVIGAGMVLTAVLVASAVQIRPDYTFSENLPRGHDVRAAFDRADAELGGLLPLSVLVRAAPDADTAALVDAAGRVAKALRAATGHHWLSIADFAALAPVGGVESLPDALVDDLVDAKEKLTVVTTVLPDRGAREIAGTIERVRDVLADIDTHGGTPAPSVTGIAALAAQGSQGMIRDLGTSLAAAAAMIFAVITLLLRSLRYGLISFVPNIAPIAMVAATLVWFDEPLRYACVLVFTICLGLAVDDTVHMVMRFRRERAAGRGVDEALDTTIEGTGRVLVATTLILVAGFAALTVSATPTVVLMGALSCLAIVTALVVDLVMLPALLAVLARR